MSDFSKLIGKTIVGITKDGPRFHLECEEANFILDGEGDCCASCWIENIDGLIVPGAKIVDVTCGGWSTIKDSDCDVEESGFYVIKTDKGDIQVDMRLSHNGYYGGWLEVRDA